MSKKLISIILLTAIIAVNSYAQNGKMVSETQGLEIGITVNDFSALDADGNVFQLQKELEKGPLVLIFYRGQWCPICNKHLSEIQDNIEKIEAKGARVIAISPQKPELAEKTAEKTKASFTLLYDEGYAIGKQFDVIFNPDNGSKKSYNTFLRANLKEAHSDNSEQLPVPATFIINKKGEIVWRHFDHDYKNRSAIEDILMQIPN